MNFRTTHDGGPAFPNAIKRDTYDQPFDGMSLRDYLAGQAMQGFIGGHIAHYGHENHWSYDQMASESFEVADAMLKARSA
jgi:hypothetical protein